METAMMIIYSIECLIKKKKEEEEYWLKLLEIF